MTKVLVLVSRPGNQGLDLGLETCDRGLRLGLEFFVKGLGNKSDQSHPEILQ